MIKYLSPSSIACFQESEEEFFLRYMVRVPRAPQTQAMAAGSAFDACCKAYILVEVCKEEIGPLMDQTNDNLEQKLKKYGTVYEPVQYDSDKSDHMNAYECLLAESVESQNVSWARDVGKRIFVDYRACGALENLLGDMEPGTCKPIDSLEKVVDGIPLLGKPDLMYRSRRFSLQVVDDWKCNGFCTSRTVSPTPGYVDMFPSRAMHKNCILELGAGMSINTQVVPEIYKLQLVIYKLLADADVVGISQLVFDNKSQLRVAKHRYRVSDSLSQEVVNDAKFLWNCVLDYHSSGSFASINAERCSQLQKQAGILADPRIASLVGR